MTILEQYIECMKKGDEVALADLFNEYGVLHDSSVIKLSLIHISPRTVMTWPASFSMRISTVFG